MFGTNGPPVARWRWVVYAVVLLFTPLGFAQGQPVACTDLNIGTMPNGDDVLKLGVVSALPLCSSSMLVPTGLAAGQLISRHHGIE